MRLVIDGGDTTATAPDGPSAYLAPMNLPGTDLFVEVAPSTPSPPRCRASSRSWRCCFCQACWSACLFCLRRDIGKRQHVQALLQAQVVLRTAMKTRHHRSARLGPQMAGCCM